MCDLPVPLFQLDQIEVSLDEGHRRIGYRSLLRRPNISGSKPTVWNSRSIHSSVEKPARALKGVIIEQRAGSA